ncbi:hypothetical protein [Agromyces laixinhei]|uniref:hypothetical protein n=1 Tax=Agromyces laixinhei TaxID=2585717 RepID=UPI00111635DC|nr:hypothetical protein [Agromyces laixinhei]
MRNRTKWIAVGAATTLGLGITGFGSVAAFADDGTGSSDSVAVTTEPTPSQQIASAATDTTLSVATPDSPATAASPADAPDGADTAATPPTPASPASADDLATPESPASESPASAS